MLCQSLDGKYPAGQRASCFLLTFHNNLLQFDTSLSITLCKRPFIFLANFQKDF